MKEKFFFIGKFLIISFILFLIWIVLGRYYLIFLAFISQFFLSLMGYQTTLVVNGEIIFSYLGAELGLTHSELTNFNIIPYIALVLASPLTWYKQIKALLIGLPIIFLFHLINLLAHFPYYYEGNGFAGMIINFSSVTRMIIPFLIWFILTYESILPLFRTQKKAYYCPICQQKKTGIIDHINNAHSKLDKKQKAKIDKFYLEHQELRYKEKTTIQKDIISTVAGFIKRK
jgi:hypothetical protein